MATFVDHIEGSIALPSIKTIHSRTSHTTYVPAAACSRVVVAARHWPCGMTKARAPGPVSSAATSTAARGAICFFGGLWVGAGRDVSNPDRYDFRFENDLVLF